MTLSSFKPNKYQEKKTTTRNPYFSFATSKKMSVGLLPTFNEICDNIIVKLENGLCCHRKAISTAKKK